MSAFPFCCVSQDCIIAICYSTKRSSTYRERSLPFSCRREKLLSPRISDNFKYPDEYSIYSLKDGEIIQLALPLMELNDPK